MFSIRLKFLAKSLLVTCLLINLYSCTYLKYTSVQAEYARIQNAKPGQVNAKHMIDRETYFIHGQTNDASGRYSNLPKAVVAFSDWYQPHERVDIMHFAVNGSHYGLNLPDGAFDILVFADIDRDGTFSQNEVVAKRSIELNDRLSTQPGRSATSTSRSSIPVSRPLACMTRPRSSNRHRPCSMPSTKT